MRAKNGVLIIESVPKKQDLREGRILKEFLKMIIGKERVHLERVKGKKEFFRVISDYNFKYIHISTHGYDDAEVPYFSLPYGNVYPIDFPINSLKNKSVVFSGCYLGKKSFCDELYERTGFKEIIAPQREISFEDSVAFFVLLYYFIFKEKKTLKQAYKQTMKRFKVKGALKHYPYRH
jgi:hypothetical protein